MTSVMFGGNRFINCAVPLVAGSRCFVLEPGDPPRVTVITERDGKAIVEILRNEPRTRAKKLSADVITVTDDADRFTYKVRPASETSVVFGTLRGEELDVRITDREIRVLRPHEGREPDTVLTASNNSFDGFGAGVVIERDGSISMGAPIPERLRMLLGASGG